MAMFSSEREDESTRSPRNVDDVKARLSFSHVRTPLPSKRPLMSHNVQMEPASPNRQAYLSKIGDYHMSRQNPDILDRMYARTAPTPGVGGVVAKTINQKESGSPICHTPKTRQPGAMRLQDGCSPSDLDSPHQIPLLRRMLNARKEKTNSPRSVVELATRGGRGKGVGLLKKKGRSPVVLTIGGGRPRRVGGRGLRSWEEVSEGIGLEEEPAGKKARQDPCDKEVVLEALRQHKRKRFATPTEEVEPHVSATASPAAIPSAKRFKSDCLNQESRTVLPHGLVFSPNGASSTLPEVPVTGNHTGTIPATVRTFGTDLSGEGRRRKEKGVASSSRGVLRLVDDTEYETESGPMEDEVGQKRSSASVVVAREEAKKMANDREESLRKLTTVFAGSGGKEQSSLRRKYPVFCATGLEPYKPTVLPSHEITHEDLCGERATTAARLRAFLEREDEEDKASSRNTDSLSASSKSGGVGVSLKALATTISSSSSIATPASSSLGGLAQAVAQLSSSATSASSISSAPQKQHVTKSVSFAPLLTQAMSTTLSTSLLLASAASVTLTANVSLSASGLLKSSLTTVTSSVSTLPSVTSSSSGGLAGGIKASLLPQPTSGPPGYGMQHKVTSKAQDTSSALSTAATSLPSLAIPQKPLQFSLPSGSLQVSGASASQSSAQGTLPTLQSAFGSVQANSLLAAKPAASSSSLLQVSQAAGTQSSGLATSTATSMGSGLQLPTGAKFNFHMAPAATLQSSVANSLQPNTLQSCQSSSAPALQLSSSTTATKLSSFPAPQPPMQQPTASLFQSSIAGQATGLPSFFQGNSSSSAAAPSLQMSQPGSKLLLQTTQANGQPSLFQTSLLPGNQPSLFQASQASTTQSSLFQTSQAPGQLSQLQSSQSNQQPSLFQAGSQSSLFQASQASSNKPLLFQGLQSTAQPSIFNVSQASSQQTLFQASQGGGKSLALQVPQGNSSSQSSLFQTSKSSLFQTSQGSSGATQPVFQASQNTSQSSVFQTPSKSLSVFQPSSGGANIFQTPQVGGQSASFNFSASTPVNSTAQSQPNIFNSSKPSTFVFGKQGSNNLFGSTPLATPNSQGFQFSLSASKPLQSGLGRSISLSAPNAAVGSTNSSFNFGAQTATPTQTPGFNFGQGQNNMTPVVQFGGSQQPGGGFNFQAQQQQSNPNIFSFSKGSAPSTPTSSRHKARGRSKKK